MSAEAEESALNYLHMLLWGTSDVVATSSSSSPSSSLGFVATFRPPSQNWSPSEPIGTTTYINYRNHSAGKSWSKKASEECFRLVAYYQAEKDESDNLKKSWLHHAIVNAFSFALTGRTIRFEGKEVKIALKDSRVNVSDYKQPNPCRRITGELDLVFYDVERQRYFFIDIKTVHSLKTKNLSEAVLKVRVAQQMRVYALLLKWEKNLEYMPTAYVLGIHVGDRGKTGYWELDGRYRAWNTIEEAIQI